MVKNKKNKKRGFLVVEVLVATSIITIAVLSAMMVAQKSVYVSRQSLNLAQAGALLEEGAEIVRIIRDDDWENIASTSGGDAYYPVLSGANWSLLDSVHTIGIFTRIITIEDVERDISTGDIVSSGGEDDEGTKLIEVAVEWVEGEEVLSRNLSFYLSRIYNE